MSLERFFVRREYPTGSGQSLVVRVTHATLDGAPCVVFEQEGVAFGGALFSTFEAVAELYEIELQLRGIHPGNGLRFVQHRFREPGRPFPKALYEEVELKGEPQARYASRWRALPAPPVISASSPTLGWPAHKSRQA